MSLCGRLKRCSLVLLAFCSPLTLLAMPLTTQADDPGNPALILIRFDGIKPRLPESNLTDVERAAVVKSVKQKFDGTNVTIFDESKKFFEARIKNPEYHWARIWVTSADTCRLGHAALCGDTGHVYDSKYIDNDRNPKFDELREDPANPNSPLDSKKLINAIENTVAHEAGHLLGLDHPDQPLEQPHIMTRFPNIEDDVTSLSFLESDKNRIKNGKFVSWRGKLSRYRGDWR